ncbi:prefoldin subunit 6 [Aphis gossypii]|uniref:Probable prefoldin subunit 6 n=1 Tax=Aphis craccivora TaxID=307492 RepID=A0A6G0Y5X8_APHCR|nr:prefoldin subunit 6 [Aphis gossypii]XP_027843691.1 prefoldin subunit 6 [Aphis gossypii]KAF0749572.1 prefoldin subunit 6 [Aphis craccivora]
MAAEELQKQFQHELDAFKQCQKEINQLAGMRQQLDGQLNENSIVKEELALLKPSGEVYKMVGPILLRQDHTEAKENIDKRMSYIKNELQRIDDRIHTLEGTQDKYRESLTKLQQQFQAQQEKK